eukprot:2669773-Amphidinium_carterae.1
MQETPVHKLSVTLARLLKERRFGGVFSQGEGLGRFGPEAKEHTPDDTGRDSCRHDIQTKQIGTVRE